MASVQLELVSGDRVDAHADLRLTDEPMLQAVALGHATSGWLIFEVPSSAQISLLIITPQTESGDTASPLTIDVSQLVAETERRAGGG